MNLKKLGRTFWVVAAVAIMAMVLQGCGGDDNGDGGISPEDQARLGVLDDLEAELPDGQELTVTYLMQLIADSGILAGLQGAVSDGQDLTADYLTQLIADSATLAGLQGAVSDGQDLTVAYLMQLLRDSGSLANLDVSAMTAAMQELDDAGLRELTPDNLKTLVDSYNDKLAADMQAAQEAHLNRVKGMAAALNTNRVGTGRNRVDEDGAVLTGGAGSGDPTTATQLPFSIDDASGTGHGVMAERGRDGMVTVTVAVDIDDPPAFTGDPAAAGAKWANAMLMRSKKDANDEVTHEESVMVYTDIEAPTERAIEADFGTGNDYVTVNSDDLRALVVPDNAPVAGSSASLSYADDAEFDGQFRGLDGTFACDEAGGCSVSTDADGEVTVAGNLEFTPDDEDDTYPVQDPNYVYFGWWLNQPTDASADHMIEGFAGGNDPAAVATGVVFENDDGEGILATYTGAAAGRYVVKSLTAGELQAEGSTVGHFNATATLTANFNAADIGDVGTNIITGTVTDFMEDGASLGNWRVTLKDATIGTTGAFNGDTDATLGGANYADVGNWQGQFYDPGETPATDAPGTAAGTFDAHLPGDAANVSGAFGAHLDDN